MIDDGRNGARAGALAKETMYLDTKYDLDGNGAEPKIKWNVQRRYLKTTRHGPLQSVRAFRKRLLNIAGISHSLLPEKRGTGGGDRSPFRAGFFVRDRQRCSTEIESQCKLEGTELDIGDLRLTPRGKEVTVAQYAVDLSVCQSLWQSLNVAGICHTPLPEKGGTGGGGDPLKTGSLPHLEHSKC
ncbi:hypothetical protein SVAN01_03915 [Stagonosporopsis vannaccii]|nr:hypothetical protein SVAN01_03915 [Stagonosporopsis vannaccii]